LEVAVGYAHPEALVSTEWVAQHRNDPGLRLIEVDVDTTAYDSGHLSGAVLELAVAAERPGPA